MVGGRPDRHAQRQERAGASIPRAVAVPRWPRGAAEDLLGSGQDRRNPRREDDGERSRSHYRDLERNRKFADSPLEGDGFEPSVPRKFFWLPRRSREFTFRNINRASLATGTDGPGPTVVRVSPGREHLGTPAQQLLQGTRFRALALPTAARNSAVHFTLLAASGMIGNQRLEHSGEPQGKSFGSDTLGGNAGALA